jgi:hypothetical protein
MAQKPGYALMAARMPMSAVMAARTGSCSRLAAPLLAQFMLFIELLEELPLQNDGHDPWMIVRRLHIVRSHVPIEIYAA